MLRMTVKQLAGSTARLSPTACQPTTIKALKAELNNAKSIESIVLDRNSTNRAVPQGKRAAVRGFAVKPRHVGQTPHDMLWDAVEARWQGLARREHPNAVPGRKFRLDIAFPDIKLAIELDGWEWHGKHKGDFTRDRERQNLLCLNGWRILRFTAGMVRKDLRQQIEIIAAAM